MVTKWSMLQERLATARVEVEKLEHEIERLENTVCGLTCGKCGETHQMESDFAKHYVLDDTRYLNLGWCPTGRP